MRFYRMHAARGRCKLGAPRKFRTIPGRKMPAAAKRARSKYRDILFEVKDQVAWVTINRPRVLNAFREHTLDEMIDALKSTREDPSIACAVVTGAGDKAFSAGGDFYAMKRLNWVNGAMW